MLSPDETRGPPEVGLSKTVEGDCRLARLISSLLPAASDSICRASWLLLIGWESRFTEALFDKIWSFRLEYCSGTVLGAPENDVAGGGFAVDGEVP